MWHWENHVTKKPTNIKTTSTFVFFYATIFLFIFELLVFRLKQKQAKQLIILGEMSVPQY